ncbi:hypothetical protein AACH06_05265 [Ideonella sp. DXS29W]|uniref:Uncharacterized protein n=1 Tax=Ideonella lacteola TaxID=2984193 RepID=A0ABU9BKD9_9BURK
MSKSNVFRVAAGLVGCAASLMLGACASNGGGSGTAAPASHATATTSGSEPASAEAPRAAASSASAGADAVAKAVTSPLSDLNLVNAPIPPVLRSALKAPYAAPAEAGCDALAANVRALDEVLGADLDTPPSPNNPGLVERGSKEVGNAAVGAIKSAAEGLVPFRSWVRKLSGAERYSKEVAAAIAAGTVRRAYLKGLGESRGCDAPASPLRSERAG